MSSKETKVLLLSMVKNKFEYREINGFCGCSIFVEYAGTTNQNPPRNNELGLYKNVLS